MWRGGSWSVCQYLERTHKVISPRFLSVYWIALRCPTKSQTTLRSRASTARTPLSLGPPAQRMRRTYI